MLVPLVITGEFGAGAGWMVSVNVAVPVPPEFVAVRATSLLPDAVGSPLTTPVVVSRLRPGGRLVAP